MLVSDLVMVLLRSIFALRLYCKCILFKKQMKLINLNKLLLLFIPFIFLEGCSRSFNSSQITDRPKISQRSPSPMAVPKDNSTLEKLENSIYQQVNQYRVRQNLAALKLNEIISEQARIHSSNMAQGKVSFSHEGFQQRIAIISQYIPYSKAAENVAYNYGQLQPEQVAVEGWLKSSGHRQNIEGDFNLTGVGVIKNNKGEYYFTQIFIRTR